ncbi:hypothetical protein SISNIDRAFT_489147 [Sistotremastrum niveocremeum HHB9708]|uniref:DUF6534 domain-containing protein n=1 Tax=Sistotremastrum niveocremeum HHB9708 TaxID=1314777 RepID=A0A164Q9Y8_9AGAM|nr:hypothetical protein SISNIDRAFT_489147 [Sistotremastrum niveocremeum HHB9708]
MLPPVEGLSTSFGLVIGLMALEFLHLAFCWHFQWFYFNAAFVDPDLLFKSVWSSVLTVPTTFLVGVLCHCFFIVRLWKISGRSRLVCGFIAALELGTSATQLMYTIRLFQLPSWLNINTELKTFMTVTLGLVSNRVSTVSIRASLGNAKVNLMLNCRTDNIISHLVYYTISNGLLTSAGDAVVLGLYLAHPESLAYLAVFEVLSKVYVIAILTSLNNRSELRTQCRTGDLEMYRDQISSPLRPSPLRTPLSGRSWPGITSPYKAETPQSPLKKFIRNSESGDATSPFPVIRIEKTIESHTDDEIFGRGATKSTSETDTASNGSSPENF